VVLPAKALLAARAEEMQILLQQLETQVQPIKALQVELVLQWHLVQVEVEQER
jgi:hypothetical protein